MVTFGQKFRKAVGINRLISQGQTLGPCQRDQLRPVFDAFTLRHRFVDIAGIMGVFIGGHKTIGQGGRDQLRKHGRDDGGRLGLGCTGRKESHKNGKTAHGKPLSMAQSNPNRCRGTIAKHARSA